MAEVYCACTIAYLEGYRFLPVLSQLGTTLESLDKRTRQLEANFSVSPPFPFTEVTWDSLTWRVCRLSRLITPTPAFKRAPPLRGAASMSLLKGAIATIETQSQTPWPETANLDEKELRSVTAQYLYRFAGKRHLEVRDFSFELEHLCSLALDLSLEAEACLRFNGGVGNRGPGLPPGCVPARPPLPPVVVVNSKTKTCCGCCSCHCHEPRRSRRDSSSSSVRSFYNNRRRRGCAVAEWFKKLAFWRRKRVIDDASSTSGTIVSDC